MPFGAQASNLPTCYTEVQFSANWGALVGQGSQWDPGITGFTMPWTGDLFVDLYVQSSYDAPATILAVEVWPNANIAPTSAWAGKVCEADAYGGWVVTPMFGRWANLAKGTYFYLGVSIRTPVINGTHNIRGCHGSIRAQAY